MTDITDTEFDEETNQFLTELARIYAEILLQQ